MGLFLLYVDHYVGVADRSSMRVCCQIVQVLPTSVQSFLYFDYTLCLLGVQAIY